VVSLDFRVLEKVRFFNQKVLLGDAGVGFGSRGLDPSSGFVIGKVGGIFVILIDKSDSFWEIFGGD